MGLPKLLYTLFFLAAALGSTQGNAQTFTAKTCKVTFETTGQPVLVKIEGKSDTACSGQATVQGDKITASEFILKLDKLDTGIPLRNKHLRENYLHIEKFPDSKLKITEITDLTIQLSGKATGPSKFVGELDLHGQKAPVDDGTYQIKNGKQVTVKFDLDLGKHGVEKPGFMGVKVVDKVHLTINFEI